MALQDPLPPAAELTTPFLKTVAPLANPAMYGGSAGAVLFGLAANEFAALAGVVIALLGLVVNIWYKHKHYKLAERRLRQEDDREEAA